MGHSISTGVGPDSRETVTLKTIVILDSSVAVTGGLRGASRMARLLRPWARTILVLPSNAVIDATDLSAFSQVVRLPLVQIRRSVLDLFLFVPALLWSGWRLQRTLARANATALIVNDFFQLQGAFARLFGFTGRIVTFVRFNPDVFPKLLARLWLWTAFHVSDQIIAVSDFIRSKLPSSPKVRRVYDVPDLDLSTGRLATADREARDIVQVGNYMVGKGQHLALAAFLQIAAEHPHTRLIFYGGDMGRERNREFRSELQQRAMQSSHGDRIIFNGHAGDIQAALATAALALNMSQSESFSLTCLEAAQLGLPVVSFRSGGPEEIIDDGKTGFLCDYGDVGAVADSIRKLLGDPVKARSMGKAAAELVAQRFRPDDYVQALREALDLRADR